MSTASELADALDDATRTINVIDNRADTIARLFQIAIREVGSHRLKEIKRELSRFNAIKGKWAP